MWKNLIVAVHSEFSRILIPGEFQKNLMDQMIMFAHT